MVGSPTKCSLRFALFERNVLEEHKITAALDPRQSGTRSPQQQYPHMKIKPTHIATVVAFATASLITACNKAPDSASAAIKITESASPAPAAPDASLPEKKVEITGNDQMKFDVVAIDAKPGQKITVTFKNAGTMPKVSMGHNFVLLAQDMDPNKFVEAGTPHMGKEFIAPELANKVIAHTKLLGPGEADTITFAAPRTTGAYHYICSFPGHCTIGMRGVLTVQ